MINDLIEIEKDDFLAKSFSIWDKGWFLLCVGDYASGATNLMTVSWGFFGTMWSKPVAIIAMRPQRYSMPLLEKYDTFTICALPPEYRQNLAWCGKNSGASGEKFSAANLHAAQAFKVEAPIVAESELVIECKKLYTDQLHAKCFMDKNISPEVYPDGDFHSMTYGEVLSIRGTKKYC